MLLPNRLCMYIQDVVANLQTTGKTTFSENLLMHRQSHRCVQMTISGSMPTLQYCTDSSISIRIPNTSKCTYVNSEKARHTAEDSTDHV